MADFKALPSGSSITYSAWATFTPTVTLVGGSGNTVPVYLTNNARYSRVGNIVFVSIYLTGDGGSEGAGTGQINIALPVTAGSSANGDNFVVGTLLNGSTNFQIVGTVSASATTIALNRVNAGAFVAVSGADQNNSTRNIRLQFFYEV